MFATPAVAGERVFIGSCSGILFALDRGRGTPQWTHDVRPGGRPTSFHGDPLITDSLIVIGTDGGTPENMLNHIWALEHRTGRLRWRHPVAGGVISDIVTGGDRVFALTRTDSLLCLDLTTGSRRWSFAAGRPAADPAYRSPVTAGGRVFFSDGGGATMHSLDARSGRSLWARDLEEPAATGVLASDGELMVGTANGRLLRLDQADGQLRGHLRTNESFAGTPVMAGDSLVILAGPRVVIAVDRALAMVRWRRELPAEISSSRPRVWRGTVLVGTVRGDLVALRLEDGVPAWSHPFDGVIRGIGDDGHTVYVGTQAGRVFAYRRPWSGPMR